MAGLSGYGTSSVFGEISKAARNLRTVTITYRDSKGNTSVRETEPYEVKNGNYFGYCLDKQSIRQFKIENIISAHVTSNDFTPRWPIQI
jgi:predicted DNA-binding transcriptional regulator YafY